MPYRFSNVCNNTRTFVSDSGEVVSGGIALQEGEYALETVVDDAHSHGGSVLTSVLTGGMLVIGALVAVVVRR